MRNKLFKCIATAVITLLIIFLLVILTKPSDPEFDGSKYEDIDFPINSEIGYYEYKIKSK